MSLDATAGLLHYDLKVVGSNTKTGIAYSQLCSFADLALTIILIIQQST